MQVYRLHADTKMEEMTHAQLHEAVASAECLSDDADALFHALTVTEVCVVGPLLNGVCITFDADGREYTGTFVVTCDAEGFASDDPIHYVALGKDDEHWRGIFGGDYHDIIDHTPDR